MKRANGECFSRFACAPLLFASLEKVHHLNPPRPTHTPTFKKTLPPIICTYGIIHPNPAEHWVKAFLFAFKVETSWICHKTPSLHFTHAKICLPFLAIPLPRYSTLSCPCHDLGWHTGLWSSKPRWKPRHPPFSVSRSGVVSICIETWMTWHWQRSEI